MFSYNFRCDRWIRSRSMFLAVLTMAATGASDLQATCDAPVPLLPTDTQRQIEGAAGSQCYRLDLQTAGLLHLDLSVAGESPSRARLSVVGSDDAATALETLGRSVTEWLLNAPAGPLFLEVTPEDPRRPLPAYRLSSRFSQALKSETDGELEPDPETFTAGCLGWKSETDGELEPDPETSTAGCPIWKSETDGELEPDPETFGAPLWQRTLCPPADGDDHGDSFTCASPIDRMADGQLANGWGDDADTFSFRLSDWQTVEISTIGDTDTHGALYDGAGLRLATDDDGGGDGNFRLVRTLAPGSYFVRVEGMRSTGPYTLAVRGLGR